jgi:CRP-like cAMP-binding protein
MVQTENLGRIIDEHPFFKGIGAELRELLIGCAANERFEAGQFLTREGQKADKFFLVRAGDVAVEVDVPGRKAIVIETLGEGEVLGWSWVVEPFRTMFDARAQTLVRALSFDGKCLRAKMAKDPLLGYEVLRRFVPMMAHRLQTARLQMLDIYGPGPTPSVARIKVERADTGAKGTNRRADAKLMAESAKPARAAAMKAEKKAEKKADKKAAKAKKVG